MSPPVTREALRDMLAPLAVRPRVFVETGTFQGRVTLLALEYFAEVHTIEKSELLYRAARPTLTQRGVKAYLGDSRDVLKTLATEIAEPAVFYLDANTWDYPDVAKDNPLLDELAILATRPAGDTIIVDEVHAFGTERPGYAAVSVEKVAAVLGVELDAIRIVHNCAVIVR